MIRLMRKSNKTFLFILILAIIGIGLLGYNSFANPEIRSQKKRWKAIGIECLSQGHTNILQHIHPHLTIKINGEKQEIPTNIGIAGAICMAEIHTHDNTGKIHVESVFANKKFTLGQFFEVWGKSFSKNEVLGYKADNNHEVVLTVDGQKSEEFENLILKDLQEILIEYKEISG